MPWLRCSTNPRKQWKGGGVKYFYDTEFIEHETADGYPTLSLISIGIVAEDGREFYAQNWNCAFNQANDWTVGHVLSGLERFDLMNRRPHLTAPWHFEIEIAAGIARFIGNDEAPELWAYGAAYDHVILFRMLKQNAEGPLKGYPFHTNELKQLHAMLGSPPLPDDNPQPHHALHDARWNKRLYEYCMMGSVFCSVSNTHVTKVFPSGFTIPIEFILRMLRIAQLPHTIMPQNNRAEGY